MPNPESLNPTLPPTATQTQSTLNKSPGFKFLLVLLIGFLVGFIAFSYYNFQILIHNSGFYKGVEEGKNPDDPRNKDLIQ